MTEITADTLRAIISEVGQDADKIADELKRISAIKRKKFDLQQKRYRAKSDYDAVIKGIAEEERALRDSCPHYTSSYTPDAAGGRGWTSCDHCGKEW